jgi:hypothetical protein
MRGVVSMIERGLSGRDSCDPLVRATFVALLTCHADPETGARLLVSGRRGSSPARRKLGLTSSLPELVQLPQVFCLLHSRYESL